MFTSFDLNLSSAKSLWKSALIAIGIVILIDELLNQSVSFLHALQTESRNDADEFHIVGEDLIIDLMFGLVEDVDVRL